MTVEQSIKREAERVAGQLRRVGLGLSLAASATRVSVLPFLRGQLEGWRNEYAYTLAVQGFVYGFPYMYNAKLRHDWVTQPRDPAHVPYAAVNHFWHAATLLDATYRDGGCPNNDTLYSIAWVDLSREPVILSHPDMGHRYFAFQLADITSDNFDYVGARTTGSSAGNFALTGPGWSGRLPPDVRQMAPSPTPWVIVLGRTLVDGPADVAAVHRLQERYRLTSLSQWGDPHARMPQRRDVLTPVDPHENQLAPWITLNAMLAENPPPEHHRLLLGQLARIGIGPHLDAEAQPDEVKRSLIRAAVIGKELVSQQFLSGDWATCIDGWRYPPDRIGRFGEDFLSRAADQSLAGVVANDPAEAVYLMGFHDADGNKLSAEGRYELCFPPGSLPPVDAYWSMTAYSAPDRNLIPNGANRYSIGDRTPGLKTGPDGSLTICLQADHPGPENDSNWLPSAKTGEWFLILRLYRPHREVISGSWRCPGVLRTA
ncbi:DUF1254 domain-containing protein [Streptomyces cellostaticus]|uniref:DUF1254 domain-containing protein n=1 Tax=Streptomyces TaxID=1883 RepID=UPI0020266C32|nr:DUF1254 domain-containing protein [Streptomyces cellostaticus]